MTVYRENPNKDSKKLVKQLSECRKATDTRLMLKNQLHFYRLLVDMWEGK